MTYKHEGINIYDYYRRPSAADACSAPCRTYITSFSASKIIKYKKCGFRKAKQLDLPCFRSLVSERAIVARANDVFLVRAVAVPVTVELHSCCLSTPKSKATISCFLANAHRAGIWVLGAVVQRQLGLFDGARRHHGRGSLLPSWADGPLPARDGRRRESSISSRAPPCIPCSRDVTCGSVLATESCISLRRHSLHSRPS